MAQFQNWTESSVNWAQESNLSLLVVLTRTSALYGVYSALKEEFISCHLFNFTATKTIEENCAEVWQKLPFKQVDFSEIKIAFNSNQCSVYPLQLDNNELQNLFAFEHGIELEDCRRLSIKSLEFGKLAFNPPIEQLEWSQKQLKAADIFDTRQFAIESDLLNKESESATLMIYPENFELVICKNNQLVFQNSFNYTSTEDVIYYTSYTLDQLKVERSSITLHIAGLELNSSLDTEVMEQYFNLKIQGSATDQKVPFCIEALLKCA